MTLLCQFLQGNNTELSTDKFVQSLYAITLDCLDIPLSSDATLASQMSEASQMQQQQQQQQQQPQQQQQQQKQQRPGHDLVLQQVHDSVLGSDTESDTDVSPKRRSAAGADDHMADGGTADMDMTPGANMATIC